MITPAKLDFYIENDFNVLMKGRHGVGKTAVISQAFERAGIKWKYFSASTMDPWVDFIGIPKEKELEDGRSVLQLVRPADFDADEVEAIFLDEFNRAKPKVRNAVMELLQFKSVNGVPFRNLRMIWVAINPDDDEADLKYDVEELDEAQADRFHIKLDIPYKPDTDWFVKEFGPEIGGGACEWWNGLSPEENVLVSPRRLEYALRVFNKGGDLRDVLPNKELNLQQLRQRITLGSITDKLAELYDASDEECEKVFNNMNFQTDAKEHIVKNKKYLKRFGKFMFKDILSDLLVEDDAKYMEDIIMNVDADTITPILSSITSAGTQKRAIVQAIKQHAAERGLDLTSEEAFKRAIEEGLQTVSGDNQKRFTGLHGVFGNFNHKASLQSYKECVRFLATLMYHVDEASLADVRKPYSQLGTTLVHKLNDSLGALYDTGVMEVWEEVKKVQYKKSDKDDNRVQKIEKFLAQYLSNTPSS